MPNIPRVDLYAMFKRVKKLYVVHFGVSETVVNSRFIERNLNIGTLRSSNVCDNVLPNKYYVVLLEYN